MAMGRCFPPPDPVTQLEHKGHLTREASFPLRLMKCANLDKRFLCVSVSSAVKRGCSHSQSGCEESMSSLAVVTQYIAVIIIILASV